MKLTALAQPFSFDLTLRSGFMNYLMVSLAGALAPLGFAPFHLPGLTLLSLAYFYFTLQTLTTKQSFFNGFFYGIGFFGIGVSWVIVSIHDYGQLNFFISGIITLIFVMYLSLFIGAVAVAFNYLRPQGYPLLSVPLFAALWCAGEYLRSTLFTGFPWLLIGTPLIDTPVKFLTPIIGIYGLNFYAALLAALLALLLGEVKPKKFIFVALFVIMLIAPAALTKTSWTQLKTDEPVSVGAVQANLSMRDKWDETLFWNLLRLYEQSIKQLLGKKLIILPESAIPLPASYLDKYLTRLNKKATAAGSGLILGILQPTNETETHYYNAIITLGTAKGKWLKQHLVPFGEYVPSVFSTINKWLNLPELNIVPGRKFQRLISISGLPLASLICYEIAYPSILAQQMPMLTERYQVVVNNDGLSSIINSKGEVIERLPPFSAGLLEGTIFPASGSTPWIHWHEYPAFLLCAAIIILSLLARLFKWF